MNKSMLMGVALGVGFATAGGVAGYQFLGTPDSQGSAAVVDEPVDGTAAMPMHEADASTDAHAVHAADTHAAHSAAAQPSAPAAQPAARTAGAQQPVQAAAQEKCYEEQVSSQPRDQKRIA